MVIAVLCCAGIDFQGSAVSFNAIVVLYMVAYFLAYFGINMLICCSINISDCYHC